MSEDNSLNTTALPGPAKGWYVAAAAVVLAAALAGALLYPSLPQTLATHWDAQGEPNGFQAKSIGSAFMSLLIAAGTIVFLYLSAVFAGTSSNYPQCAGTPEERRIRTVSLARATQRGLGLTTLALSFRFAYIALGGWLWPTLVFTAVVVGGFGYFYSPARLESERELAVRGRREPSIKGKLSREVVAAATLAAASGR